jgi:thiamine-phosphate pyrophosphorylase
MTDERQGEVLWAALAALPRGAGVVFRHHRTPPDERRRLYEKVRAVARRRRLVLVLAGPARVAAAWRADGAHGRAIRRSIRPLLFTAPAHDRSELVAAREAGADLVFLSPLFATRSHPGGRTLGLVRFGMIAQAEPRTCVIALGGMDATRARRLRELGSYGWAAIDALTPNQKRKAVPT